MEKIIEHWWEIFYTRTAAKMVETIGVKFPGQKTYGAAKLGATAPSLCLKPRTHESVRVMSFEWSLCTQTHARCAHLTTTPLPTRATGACLAGAIQFLIDLVNSMKEREQAMTKRPPANLPDPAWSKAKVSPAALHPVLFKEADDAAVVSVHMASIAHGCAFNPAHDGLFCDCCKLVSPPAGRELSRAVLDCGHKICHECAGRPRILTTHGKMTKDFRGGPYGIPKRLHRVLCVKEQVLDSHPAGCVLAGRPSDSNPTKARIYTHTEGYKPHKGDCPICRIDATVTAEHQIKIANEAMVRPMELCELRSAKIVGDDEPPKEGADGDNEYADDGAGPEDGDDDNDDDDAFSGGADTAETYEHCVIKVNKVLSSKGYENLRDEVLEVIKRLYPAAH